MIQIPDEFREIASYFYAGRSLEPVNKVSAIVLYHVFADNCKEIVEVNKSPKLQEFIDIFVSKLPPFPLNGPDEVRFVAGELYGALHEKIQEGKLNSNMPEQFALCSKLYSILDGDFAVIRESKCKFIASKLQVLFRDLENKKKEQERKEREKQELLEKKRQEKEAKQLEKENKKAPIQPVSFDDSPISKDAKTEIPSIKQRTMTSNDLPQIPTSQPQFYNGYDPQHVRNYLGSIGIDTNKVKAPPYNDNLKNVIQKYLDLGTSCIKRGDTDMALEFLQKPKKTWLTGH